MAREVVLRTETVVDAPPDEVWEWLIDLPRWDTWNPTLFGVAADAAPPQPGREIRMRLQLGRVTLHMRQQVRVVDPPRELTWRSKQLVPAPLFDVLRSFRLEPLEGGRTRFVQSELMTGFLAKPMSLLTGKLVVRGYENLGRALASRVGEREG